VGIRIARVAGLAALLTGCAQIAGIDETSLPPDAPAPTSNSLTIQRISIGATIVEAPQDLTGQTATYYVPADEAVSALTAVPATVEGNKFVGLVEQAAIVEFTLPDLPVPETPIIRGFDVPARDLTAAFTVLEHPNPTNPLETDSLTFTLTSDVPGAGLEAYQLYIVGAWAVRSLPPPAALETTLAITEALYSTLTSISGRPLEKFTAADSILVLRYGATNNQLLAVLEVPAVDQTGADLIAGTLVPVTLDQNVAFPWDTAAIAARFAAVRPAPSAASLAANWALRAAPGAGIANDAGPTLAASTILTDGMQTEVTTAFTNPFASRWPTVLTVATGMNRSFAVPTLGGLPVTLSSGMRQQGAPTTTVSFPAELPAQVEFDGTLLSVDGQELRLPTKPVVISFTTTTPHTLYGIGMYELVPNAVEMPTAALYKNVFNRTTAAPSFVIPADRFVVGKSYVVRLHTWQGGFTGVATGNLKPNAMDISHSFHDAAVFTVVP
jgi:hypothetical protein